MTRHDKWTSDGKDFSLIMFICFSTLNNYIKDCKNEEMYKSQSLRFQRCSGDEEWLKTMAMYVDEIVT